jgi:hypothetical protein
MRNVLVLVSLITFLIAVDAAKSRPKWNELDGYTFDAFMKDFGRRYTGEEYAKRKAIFEARLESVRRHNADGTRSWKRGVNAFSDMSAEEWRRFNRGVVDADVPAPTFVHTAPTPTDNTPLPHEVDYRTWTSPKVLTAVKHQGSCGSCWAHSAAESLESYFALLTGRLPVISTQQLTSCTTACYGCNGGNPVSAWMYVNTTFHGATEEWAYPFSNFFWNLSNPNEVTAPCTNVTSLYPNKTPYTWFAELTRVGVAGYVRIESNSAKANMHALATRGPLSVFVAAGNWQDYETGVFENTNSSGANNEWSVDHVVQMVGYGYDKQVNRNYWIVRNSWSTNWGEDGFIRLDRPDVEPCSPASFGPACGTSGVLYYNHYPIVRDLPPTDF